MEDNDNLAQALARIAASQPAKPAVIVPNGRDGQGRAQYAQSTFVELAAEMDLFAAGFQRLGVTPGMRVVLMVRPGLEFLPLTFALFKIGAVPVLIDPGMGRQKLLHCVATAQPEAFVGIPLAHMARLIFRKYFRSVKINVTIGRRLFWGGADLRDLRRPPTSNAPPPPTTKASDPAAIIFTTGSTGPPKGVVYTHGMFAAQCRLLRDAFSIDASDVDMPGFALFAIFSLPLGATVVIPEMDPTRPAQVDPTNIIEAVHDHGVTFSFGSPALWRRVAAYCQEHDVHLPTLTRVLMAGAPIPAYLHEQLLGGILPEGANVHTPYGATESLPMTSIEGSEVLRDTAPLTRQGRGYCVGRPLPGIEVKIIRTTDDPLPRWAQAEELPAGDKGEIVVRGPIVSREYYSLPEQTARHKIYDTNDEANGAFWHRMGDVGYFDEVGRVWFCGRKSHRVETADGVHLTVCCEAVFNEHPRVYRSALVGLGPDRGRQQPLIIVEPEAGQFPSTAADQEGLRKELLELGAQNELTTSIRQVFFHQSFPVDIRHNAKIFREKLARWAARQ